MNTPHMTASPGRSAQQLSNRIIVMHVLEAVFAFPGNELKMQLAIDHDTLKRASALTGLPLDQASRARLALLVNVAAATGCSLPEADDRVAAFAAGGDATALGIAAAQAFSTPICQAIDASDLRPVLTSVQAQQSVVDREEAPLAAAA
jgi:hypothetical protein